MEREEVLKEIQVLKSLLDSANHNGVTNLADLVVIKLTELLKQL